MKHKSLDVYMFHFEGRAATGLTTIFYLNCVDSLAICVFSLAAGLNKSCLNESVAMSE